MLLPEAFQFMFIFQISYHTYITAIFWPHGQTHESLHEQTINTSKDDILRLQR